MVGLGCKTRNASSKAAGVEDNVPRDKMTYRVNPRTKEAVSLLGFGCMRWPRRPKEAATGEDDQIDQEAVNALLSITPSLSASTN